MPDPFVAAVVSTSANVTGLSSRYKRCLPAVERRLAQSSLPCRTPARTARSSPAPNHPAPPLTPVLSAVHESNIAGRRTRQCAQVMLTIRPSQEFRAFDSAWRTLQGIDTMNMIGKAQVRWLPNNDVVGQADGVTREPPQFSFTVLFSRMQHYRPRGGLAALLQYGDSPSFA